MKCAQTEIIIDFKCNYSPGLLILETEAASSIPSILCENLKSTVGIAVSLVKLTLKQQKGLFLCFQTRNLIKKKATLLHVGCPIKGKLTLLCAEFYLSIVGNWLLWVPECHHTRWRMGDRSRECCKEGRLSIPQTFLKTMICRLSCNDANNNGLWI